MLILTKQLTRKMPHIKNIQSISSRKLWLFFFTKNNSASDRMAFCLKSVCCFFNNLSIKLEIDSINWVVITMLYSKKINTLREKMIKVLQSEWYARKKEESQKIHSFRIKFVVFEIRKIVYMKWKVF